MASLKSLTNVNVMSWNANSIISKKDEFVHFIKTKNIGVAMISETFLNPGSKFSITNFTTYRNDRPTLGGGTAIVVKRGIEHFEAVLPTLNSIEATSMYK